MKVIFLDFDGVISTLGSHYRLNFIKMQMIRDICVKTGAKIVITSSWRYNNLQNTIEKITNVDDIPYTLSDLTIGCTERIYYTDSKGKHYHAPRGVEIDHYIENHDVSEYVIIDDDQDMMLHHKDNFIHTDTYDGISEYDVKIAIRKLNSDIIEGNIKKANII